MKVFRQIFIANLKEFIRDKSALFWFLAFPVIFIFIFGMVYSGNGEQVFDIGVVKNFENNFAIQITETLESVPNFNIHYGELSEEKSALNSGNRSMVIVIPEIDLAQIREGEESDIKLLYDSSKQQSSQILISVIKQIFNEIERKVTGRPQLFNINTESIQADNLSSFDFNYILPGILAMALMQLGLFGGLQFLSLREQGIIRGLGVTPLPRVTLLGSEILIRVIMALVQTFVIIFFGMTFFDLKVSGNFLYIIAFVILGALTFISLGYMIISFANSPESGERMIQVVQFPMMFLSGIFFPITIMPDYIKPVVKAIPLTYLGDGLRQMMVGVVPEYTMRTNILVLVAWLVITLFITIKFWRWD
ncbi:MAG: ABC transporter permease [Bacillota bacterium]